MKLITRPECPHCDAVKEWLATHKPDLKIEIECLETKVVDSAYSQYSDRAPILLTGWGFVAGSHAIIDYFQTLA